VTAAGSPSYQSKPWKLYLRSISDLADSAHSSDNSICTTSRKLTSSALEFSTNISTRSSGATAPTALHTSNAEARAGSAVHATHLHFLRHFLLHFLVQVAHFFCQLFNL
jgi:hypothetical protein